MELERFDRNRDGIIPNGSAETGKVNVISGLHTMSREKLESMDPLEGFDVCCEAQCMTGRAKAVPGRRARPLKVTSDLSKNQVCLEDQKHGKFIKSHG